MSEFQSGFVSIIGEPNVGKSTLINRIVGEKVAIVSPKPQTTRENIIGVYNDDLTQIVFVDTPGVHKSVNKIDEYMDANINLASEDNDIIIFCLSAKKDLNNQFEKLKKYHNSKGKKIVIINKIDDTTFEKLYPQLADFSSKVKVDEILPISALNGKNCDVLINIIKKYLPKYDSPMLYYPIDMYTDKNMRFIASETIREKVLLLLNDELPHGVAIQLNIYEETDELLSIEADIVCEKESHKQIIIGANGASIKKISTFARQSLEKISGQKVFLKLFVKVKQNWRNSTNYCNIYGYDMKNLK